MVEKLSSSQPSRVSRLVGINEAPQDYSQHASAQTLAVLGNDLLRATLPKQPKHSRHFFDIDLLHGCSSPQIFQTVFVQENTPLSQRNRLDHGMPNLGAVAFQLLTNDVKREIILLVLVVMHLEVMIRMPKTKRLEPGIQATLINMLTVDSCRRTSPSTSSPLHLPQESAEKSARQRVQTRLRNCQ